MGKEYFHSDFPDFSVSEEELQWRKAVVKDFKELSHRIIVGYFISLIVMLIVILDIAIHSLGFI